MEKKRLRTSIIPIFIPHIGCPYRCVFCNQWRITGHEGVPDASEVRNLIDTYTRGVEKRHWEAAFYGGSFTAIPGSLQAVSMPFAVRPGPTALPDLSWRGCSAMA